MLYGGLPMMTVMGVRFCRSTRCVLASLRKAKPPCFCLRDVQSIDKTKALEGIIGLRNSHRQLSSSVFWGPQGPQQVCGNDDGRRDCPAACTGAYLEENRKANGAWGRNSLPLCSGEQAYLLIIFRLVAAIVMVPPFSVTSPVSSTLWLRWGTSFALLFAARSPVTV